MDGTFFVIYFKSFNPIATKIPRSACQDNNTLIILRIGIRGEFLQVALNWTKLVNSRTTKSKNELLLPRENTEKFNPLLNLLVCYKILCSQDMKKKAASAKKAANRMKITISYCLVHRQPSRVLLVFLRDCFWYIHFKCNGKDGIAIYCWF